jgi:hypothetical protein
MKIRIENLDELYEARVNGWAVICPNYVGFAKPKPAAFMMNMSCSTVRHMIHIGVYLHVADDCLYRKILKSKESCHA